MRSLILILFISASVVLASPTVEQTVLGGVSDSYSDFASGLLGNIAKGVEHTVHNVLGNKKVPKHAVNRWINSGKEYIEQNGLTCTFLEA